MGKWSRADILGVINLVVAVLGFLVLLVGVAPSLLPEVVIVVDLTEDAMEGLSTAITTFENVSAQSPVNSLEAVWRVEATDAITVAVDRHAPRHSLEGTAAQRMLRTLEPMPARLQFRTIFNSPKPFKVLGVRGHATRMVIGPGGNYSQEVPVIPRQLYSQLLRDRYVNVALLLGTWILAYLLLLWLTKLFLRSTATATRVGGQYRYAKQRVDESVEGAPTFRSTP